MSNSQYICKTTKEFCNVSVSFAKKTHLIKYYGRVGFLVERMLLLCIYSDFLLHHQLNKQSCIFHGCRGIGKPTLRVCINSYTAYRTDFEQVFCIHYFEQS